MGLVLVMGGCGGSTAPSGPAAAGAVSDPAGDTLPPPALLIAPDLVAATVDVSGGALTATVTFAPGTMSRTLTLTSLVLDIDENPATGSAGLDPAQTDSALIGADYIVNAVAPRGTLQGRILRAIGPPNQFVAAGTVPVSFPAADQMRVSVPLSLLGDDDGRMKFKVVTAQYLSDNLTTGVTDFMPNAGLPAGVVR